MSAPMISRENLERAFVTAERAAVAGERCPTNAVEGNPDGIPHGALPALARQGRVRVEVYAHNWRVVEITAGPNKGRRTAEPPNRDWRPYRIIDQGGDHRSTENGLPTKNRPITLPRIKALETAERS